MKALEGAASGIAEAGIEPCFELLSDLETYPRWYPDTVTSAQVLAREQDGSPAQAVVGLRFTRGSLRFDREVPLTVTLSRPELIVLERLPDAAHDPEQLRVIWRLRSLGAERTELRAELSANLALPSFLPGLGGVAEGVAQGFLEAAVRTLAA